MQLEVRRSLTMMDRKYCEAGKLHDVPLVRTMCALVVANPYSGKYVDDMSEMVEASRALGRLVGAMIVEAMRGESVEGYGKGGVVGLGGELEHANALLTTTFANPVREAIGGALAWIPSFTKRAAPGATFAPATATMTDETIPLFSFPAIQGKIVTAAFDGGRLSSDGGVMLLSMAERRLGVAERLARCIPDRRDPSRIVHTFADMIRARVFAICCGYEDADDLDVLRSDPAFKLACGRLPDSGRDLCSQPTLSRLENAPRLKDVIRLTYALVDQWMASYACTSFLIRVRWRTT